MERRSFLRSACRACMLGAGTVFIGDSLVSCAAPTAKLAYNPAVINNQVEVPFTLFEKQTMVIISPAKYQYEIAIEKQGPETFKALLLRCTHYDNQLTPTGNGYTCSLHGSRFTKEGAVVNGPASKDLRQLKTENLKDRLLIYL